MALPASPDLVYSDAPPHASIVWQHSGPAEQTLAKVRDLHLSDKAAESRKRAMGKVIIGVAVVVIAGLFAGVISDNEPLMIVAGVGLAVLVVLAVVKAMVGRNDVDDRKVDVVRRLVTTFRPEMHRKHPVKIWIDFNGYIKAKPVEDTTTWARRTGTKVFHRPWLRMSFRLLDGSEVSVHVRTVVKRKQKAKRKYTKVKDRIVDEINVFVKPAANRVLDPEAGERARGAVGQGGALQARSVRLKPRLAVIGFVSQPGVRVCGRTGWSGRNLRNLVQGDMAVEAVMRGYRAAAAARAE